MTPQHHQSPFVPTLDDVKRLAAELDIEYQNGEPHGFGLAFYQSSGAGDYYSIPGGIPLAYVRLKEIADARLRFAQHMAPFDWKGSEHEAKTEELMDKARSLILMNEQRERIAVLEQLVRDYRNFITRVFCGTVTPVRLEDYTALQHRAKELLGE